MRTLASIIGVVLVTATGCADEEAVTPETGSVLCFDMIDNDRNGVTDCDDPGCSFACTERDCTDGIDNDSDGVSDCDDDDCGAREFCKCEDGRDNDLNGKIDCGDNACLESEVCEAPPGMRVIAGGTFEKGCASRTSTRPVHDVTVPSFYIDLAPITVEQYKACIESGSCSEPPTYEEHSYCTWGPHPDLKAPIRCVTWVEARTYCQSREMRLCSESEWEYVFERGIWAFGMDSRIVSSIGSGAEFVEDCWVPNYGQEHPDGTVELDVPTDGSAVRTGGCSRRVVRTVTNLSIIEDGHCLRSPVETSVLYTDTFFRCCGDLDIAQ